MAGNKFEAFELAAGLAEEIVSDVSLVQFTSPDLYKVPASCARVLSEGSEAAIVFATLSASQAREAVPLVVEKVIDVEIHSAKFVFTAFVFEDEWRTETKLAKVAEQKIRAALEMAVGMKPSANSAGPTGSNVFSSSSESALPEVPAGMGMFSPPPESSTGEPDSSAPPSPGGSPLF